MVNAPGARAAPRTSGDALKTLLVRLLMPVDVRAMEAVRRSAADGHRTLSRLERASVVRRIRMDSPEQLAGIGRAAVCLLPGDRAVMIESAGGERWWVDRGQGAPGALLRRSALAPWFPCEVVVASAVRESTDAPTVIEAGVSKVSVYLRLAAQVLGLSTPIAMMLIIDKVVTQGARDTLVALLIGVALLTVFQYLFQLVHAVHACRESEARALPIRRRVLQTLLGSQAATAWSSVGWDVIQAASECGRFAEETRPQMLADVMFVGLLVVLMASFSASLAAVSLAFVPLYVLVAAWTNRCGEPHAAGSTALRSRLSAQYHEAVAAAELIQSMHVGAHVAARWEETDGRLAASGYRLALCRRLSGLGVEFLQRSSLLVIMLLGVSSVIAGSLTLGQYIAFNLLSMQLAQPVLRLAAYRRARADHRLRTGSARQLEAGCGGERWPSGRLPVPAAESLVLEADDVVLWRDGPGPLRLVLHDRLWLGVVGPSGCGKTTLLRAMAGLHRPHRGRIRLNGVPVARLDDAGRAGTIRLVPQDAVVFSGSIAENIRLGDPAALPEQILAAAQVCGLEPLLERLPAHLDTVVGPAGQALSGGERQRVAIARAIVSRPRILLLDEATAAIDLAGEGVLLRNLRHYLPDSAVVVVSHRPSSLSGCRQIVRLDAPAREEVAVEAGRQAAPLQAV